ncbi:MAG: type II toxin-antitoxin system mRNA interferase toxin, RelE/StbE family [Alphaproteobacteria bacterium]|nr:type II toxin-antitoxin system mRNA interferase toxin, RelE/StbE family [Alphaproteobacteria bacterium]
MRTIRRTTQFKRDYKRELKGRFGKTLEGDLRAVLSLLVSDTRLPERYRDHPLAGE